MTSGSLNLNDNLEGLSNVFLPNPLDTEVLTFQASTGLWIASAAGGGGEANTSSNVGTGEGLALAKVGVDLPFKSLIGEANRIVLTGNANDVTFTLGTEVVLNVQNNDFGAFFQDYGEIVVPANPAINVRRLFVDAATGEMSVRTNAGATVSLEAGGSQTPWLSDIVADGFDLRDLSNIEFRSTTGIPAGTIPYILWDTLDMTLNVPSGDEVSLAVAGTIQYSFSATALTMNNNNLILGTGQLQLQGATTRISGAGLVMEFDTPTGGIFRLKINGANEYIFDATALTLSAGNNLIILASGASGYLEVGALTTPATPANGLGKYYTKEISTITTPFFIGDDGVEIDLSAGGGEVFTWTADHSMATFKLTASAANDVILNAPTAQGVSIEVNAIQEYLFNATALTMNNNNLILGTGILQFVDANQSIQNNAGNLFYDIATGQVHLWRINLVTQMQLSATALAMQGNAIIQVAFLTSFAADPSTAGTIRLGNAQSIDWRDAGNTANLGIVIDASDELTFVGTSEVFGSKIISNHATVTAVAGDFVLILDATDTTVKKVNASDFLAGAGDMVLADAQTVTGIKTFLDTTMKLRNVANTFDAFFVNTVTADRIYTLPDFAGTVLISGNSQIVTGDISATAAIVETQLSVAVGVSGTVLTSNGVGSAPTYQTGGAGDMVLADIQVVTGLKTFNDTRFALRNVADTFSASFVNTISVDRIYTLPDAAGTVIITGLANQITNTELTSGVFAKITGLGTQTQALDIAAQGITVTSRATGDILKDNGTNLQRFARGSANEVLKVNAGATDLEYGLISDANISATADIVVTKLLEGTTGGQYLRTNSGATAAEWTDDIFTISILIDGGGSVITTGKKGTLTVDFACEVLEWAVIATGASGAIVVDINRSTFAGFPTTSSIASTEKPTITATSDKGENRSLALWSTIATGDVIEWEVDSITAITLCSVNLVCRKTG